MHFLVQMLATRQVYRFGRPDLTGRDALEPEGGPDYLEWGPRAGPFPRKVLPPGAALAPQVSLCFSKRYLSLDSWSSGQKTILRIFQVGVDEGMGEARARTICKFCKFMATDLNGSKGILEHCTAQWESAGL
jgi:hypothetical protein